MSDAPDAVTRHRLAPPLGLDAVVEWSDDLIVRTTLEPSGSVVPAPAKGPQAEFERWIQSWNAARPEPFDASLIDWTVVPVRTSRILEVLFEQPFGKALTYGELGALCGIPRGARAIGQAMARNPFPLVVPCHRVVVQGGHCGEYSAGGPEVKRALLLHEGVSL